jgi:hypothetical protein
MRVYDYGHECETEELTQTLSALSPAQRRAVRSYVRNVEFEGMTLKDWLLTEDAPAESTWNKPGGNYWGSNANPNHIFRAAVQEYTEAYTKWTLRAEQRQIRAAGGIMAGGLVRAARRLVTLVDEGENDRIKLDAAKDLLNRFKDTASQAPASAQGESSELSDEERASRIAAILDAARARRIEQAGGERPADLAAVGGTTDDGVPLDSG